MGMHMPGGNLVRPVWMCLRTRGRDRPVALATAAVTAVTVVRVATADPVATTDTRVGAAEDGGNAPPRKPGGLRLPVRG